MRNHPGDSEFAKWGPKKSYQLCTLAEMEDIKTANPRPSSSGYRVRSGRKFRSAAEVPFSTCLPATLSNGALVPRGRANAARRTASQGAPISPTASSLSHETREKRRTEQRPSAICQIVSQRRTKARAPASLVAGGSARVNEIKLLLGRAVAAYFTQN